MKHKRIPTFIYHKQHLQRTFYAIHGLQLVKNGNIPLQKLYLRCRSVQFVEDGNKWARPRSVGSAVAVSLGSNDLLLFRSLRFARLGDVGKYAHISCNGAEDSDTRAWLLWFTKLKNNYFRKPGPERYYPACDLMVWGVAVCSYPFCTNINWPEWKNYCRVVWA